MPSVTVVVTHSVVAPDLEWYERPHAAHTRPTVPSPAATAAFDFGLL